MDEQTPRLGLLEGIPRKTEPTHDDNKKAQVTKTLAERILDERLPADRHLLKEKLRATSARRGQADRELLRDLVRCDNASIWLDEQRSPSQWIGEQLGISQWRAARLLNAARAIESLPYISECLCSGSLSLEKVVELARFASPDDEVGLAQWAWRVNVSTIRQRADRAQQTSKEEVKDAYDGRSVTFMSLDDHRSQMLAVMPHAHMQVVKDSITRLAETLPPDPTESGETLQVATEADASFEQRCADALVALASTRIADDQDPDRATVLVDAPLAVLANDEGSASIAGGPALHPETARRLTCDGRIEFLVTAADGRLLDVDRAKRIVPFHLRRAVFKRDDFTCTFPNCTSRRFLHPHHIIHWAHGGETMLENLITVCTSHHHLIHEMGWSVSLSPSGHVSWFKPSGRIYTPGIPPPDPEEERHYESVEPLTMLELRSFNHVLRFASYI